MREVLVQVRREGGNFEEPLDVDDLIRINPNYDKLADFPTTLDFLLDYGPGGMTWVGSYGPGRTRPEGGWRRVSRFWRRRGFPRSWWHGR